MAAPSEELRLFPACGELATGIWGGGGGCRKFSEGRDGTGSDSAWDEWTVLGEGAI